jgi:hypothetical protein
MTQTGTKPRLIFNNIMEQSPSCGPNIPSARQEAPCFVELKTKTKRNSVALARERNMQTERPLLVGEVSANFCG